MGKFIVKMDSIAILVLAAGKSSRMKSVKQLLKINNKTLLENTLENAKKINEKSVFCVLGANAEKIKKETSTKNINYIFNENYESGLSSSIVSGIIHLKKENKNFDGVLILLADQPEVDVKYLNHLATIFQENKNYIIASNYNSSTGVPAIFAKKHFNKLLLLKGDKGAKKFIQNNISEVIKVLRKSPFIDIDTQEDYLAYKKLI